MSGAVIAASVARARHRIERDLELAVGPEHAVAYAPPRRAVERRVFRQLVHYGAVVQAEQGRYYVDPQRMELYRASRRRRGTALAVLAIAGIGAAIVLSAAMSFG